MLNSLRKQASFGLPVAERRPFLFKNRKDTGVSDREAIDLIDRLDPGTLAQALDTFE
jgi:hypothetical protein